MLSISRQLEIWQHIIKQSLIFIPNKVEEDLMTLFLDNGHGKDTLFFLLQVLMIHLRLKLDFTHKFLDLEDFHNQYNLAILEQRMDPLVKIQDRYKHSGDQ